MGRKFHTDIELETKPDFLECMDRVYAWYENEIIDRVPVRFSAHNAEYSVIDQTNCWNNLKEKWFDTEYQIKHFEKGMEGKVFLGETFPVYWPNLGPNVYPCMLGGDVEFGDVTTWAKHMLGAPSEYDKIHFSMENEYFKKLEEMTKYALSRCKGKYLVGYTDIHSGADAADALRGTQELLMDLYDEPEETKKLIEVCSEAFGTVFEYFNKIIKDAGQPSVTWIDIPSFDTFHIPGTDLGAMLSTDMYNEYILPEVKKEVKYAKHNVFHVDGKGVARHLDSLLEIDEICGYQWVQGMGADEPIMQWVPLIKKIQDHKKGVVVDLKPKELDMFMEAVNPKGIYLCIDTTIEEEQRAILKKLEKWK